MISLVKVSDVLAATAGTRPPAKIDVTDDSATEYWAYRLNISTNELFSAIQEVGPSIAAVRRHLHK